MKWTMEEAKEQLPSIINATSQEPQLIYSQEKLVAVIVDPKMFQEFLNWRQQTAKISLAQFFQELQQLCTEENYTLEIPARRDSVNKLIEELSTIALAEFDAYTRFKAIAATGNPEAGLRILAKLDSLTAENL